MQWNILVSPLICSSVVYLIQHISPRALQLLVGTQLILLFILHAMSLCVTIEVFGYSYSIPPLQTSPRQGRTAFIFSSFYWRLASSIGYTNQHTTSSHYEKYGRFLITQRKPSRATTELTLFTVSKDEWNTKEDTGKSLKNALHVLRCAKRHFSG